MAFKFGEVMWIHRDESLVIQESESSKIYPAVKRSDILGLGRNEDETANAHVSQNIDLFYVGETEGIRQRLQQHRRTFKSKGYDYLEAIIVPVYDKSLAKTLESLVIQNFKKASIPLIADKDGSRHVGMRSKC